jgi:hypothetical protein
MDWSVCHDRLADGNALVFVSGIFRAGHELIRTVYKEGIELLLALLAITFQADA